MTALPFEIGTLRWPRNGTRARPQPPADRGRLAIVSAYDELCGVAAYTRALERQLRDSFDITVFGLDQQLLRNRQRRLRRLGDGHIAEICAAIADYDGVNLQLEHGTLGLDPADIGRRLQMLVKAAPRLSVTFHTVFAAAPPEQTPAWQELCRLNLAGAVRIVAARRRLARLAAGPLRTLRRAQSRKPIAVIVHNRRDRRYMERVGALREVYDHPLSFVSAQQAEAIRACASRRDFPLLDGVAQHDRLIGVFGFLGQYKGLETAVRALHHLPEEYHLAIVGGVHPNGIRRHQPIDPVIAAIFEAGFVDTSLVERLAATRPAAGPALSLGIDGALRELLLRHPQDLSHRLHFLGALHDEEFLRAMTLCEAAIFPYLEVGQSASGPLSQALELGCRIIAARTHAFLQFARYHRDMIEFFDIGNHLELAARIRARPQYPVRGRRLAYTVETNKAVYIAANGGPALAGAAPGRALARAG